MGRVWAAPVCGFGQVDQLLGFPPCGGEAPTERSMVEQV